MGRRAQSTEQTRLRILEAGVKLFMASYYDQVTLEAVATGAETSLPTVLRHFVSKDALFLGVMEYAGQRVPDARNAVAPGDVEGAVRAVIRTLEAYGDATARLRYQAERVDVLAPMARGSYDWHHAWVDRTFGPLVGPCGRAERRRRIAALSSVTDVFSWRLLRREYGLSEAATHQTMLMSVRALLRAFAEGES